ncbi:nitrite reductase/ring-hydroxylating ferredoxin subunit [Rhodanobacter sp. K2T2]|uniref:Rieske (2Fe-2S) protein n=1 Tax=Rhodanobacter sp. K2T2 TaxID=2723085 RepID=UPI0015CA9D39|nr:Rieske (2Fe-2S) protein [Rhodanobacter sp. K2T2]NYE28554.1 nitrite reductase/ring-hydroxylating ferredoxin subunit [Rhodanobacter sp. K2T2]
MDTVTSAVLPSGQALCALQDVPDGGAVAVDATLSDGEENIILLRQGGEVRAYCNICPHAGRQLDYAPGQFLLSKGTLICAVHGASFDQTNGLCIGGPCKGDSLRSVAVRVHDGEIFLA